jgi:hypothetical protein
MHPPPGERHSTGHINNGFYSFSWDSAYYNMDMGPIGSSRKRMGLVYGLILVNEISYMYLYSTYTDTDIEIEIHTHAAQN